MGDRGQVLILEGDVYLYTHWRATELIETVRKALTRGKGRWNDPEYLARIIFSEMVRDDIDGLTGYGIGTQQHGDVWRLVTINCQQQLITVSDNGKTKLSKSFSEFIE